MWSVELGPSAVGVVRQDGQVRLGGLKDENKRTSVAAKGAIAIAKPIAKLSRRYRDRSSTIAPSSENQYREICEKACASDMLCP